MVKIRIKLRIKQRDDRSKCTLFPIENRILLFFVEEIPMKPNFLWEMGGGGEGREEGALFWEECHWRRKRRRGSRSASPLFSTSRRLRPWTRYPRPPASRSKAAPCFLISLRFDLSSLWWWLLLYSAASYCAPQKGRRSPTAAQAASPCPFPRRQAPCPGSRDRRPKSTAHGHGESEKGLLGSDQKSSFYSCLSAKQISSKI